MNSNLVNLRKHARQIFEAGLKAVDPMEAIIRHVTLNKNVLTIDARQFHLTDYDRSLVVGAGKAVAPMAKAIEDLLGNRISGGVIVVKDEHGLPLKKIKVCEAGSR